MSLPPPEPNPVDAALAAYVEQKIEKRLEAERASLLAAQREFCERLRELRLLTTRLEDSMARLAAIRFRRARHRWGNRPAACGELKIFGCCASG
jgi:hypothetical protein